MVRYTKRTIQGFFLRTPARCIRMIGAAAENDLSALVERDYLSPVISKPIRIAGMAVPG